MKFQQTNGLKHLSIKLNNILYYGKKGNQPLPVDFGMFKDITLSLIDNSVTVAELTLNVLHEVNK